MTRWIARVRIRLPPPTYCDDVTAQHPRAVRPRGSTRAACVTASVTLTVMCALAACQRHADERIFQGGRLGMVSLVRPQRNPGAMIFLFSDLDGWNASYNAVAWRLAGAGAVVVGVDLPEYLRGLAANPDGCHYVIAEIEDMSERLQRDLRFSGYQSPILAGIGAGGALAYAALAQAPAVTVAGAISVDPTAVLPTKVPLCAGAPATPIAGGGFSYGPRPQLNGWWHVSLAAPVPAPTATVIEQSHGVLLRMTGSQLERLAGRVSGPRASHNLFHPRHRDASPCGLGARHHHPGIGQLQCPARR